MKELKHYKKLRDKGIEALYKIIQEYRYYRHTGIAGITGIKGITGIENIEAL